ncbi:hypothetical protein MYX84_03980 [Acidobacteria bacterium AH-259-O06]|nr:hypothetical protein [Acidobacteria bacterium AH-259-O06]
MFQFIKKFLMGKQAPPRELGGWVLFLARPDDEDIVEVSPLDGTALARQFQFSALRRLETSHLRPTMTGPTKTEDRRGMKLQRSLPIVGIESFPAAPQGRGHEKKNEAR